MSARLVTPRLVTEGQTGPQTAWELTINVPANEIRCGDIRFPLPNHPWPRPDLRVFLDGSVIESFIGGREAITSRAYTLKPNETTLEIEISGPAHATIETWPLKAISPDRMTGRITDRLTT
jgi:hypothetical protein